MINYIKVSKDLGQIKQKSIFGLTKRQLICFSIGLGMGFPVFYIAKHIGIDLSISLGLMMIVAAPALFCGLYFKNGLFFEEHIKNIIKFKKRGTTFVFKSHNPYKQIQDEIECFKIKRLLRKNGVNVKKKGVTYLGKK